MQASTKHLLLVTGPDAAGITSHLLRTMQDASSQGEIELLDFGQSVVGGALSLSFSLQTRLKPAELKKLQSSLRREAKRLKVALQWQKQSASARPRRTASTVRYAITLIAPQLELRALTEITRILAQNQANITRIRRLSQNSLSCVELSVTLTKDRPKLRETLMEQARELGIDLGIQRESLFRRSKRLIVLDVDSTLIQNEVIDELARENGVFDQVAPITERAMRGEISYDASLQERVRLLKGLDRKSLDRVYARIQLTPGAEELLSVLRCLGLKVAIISGGFHFVVDRIKERLGIHYAFANTLVMRDGKVTGEVLPPIVNAQRKADLLDALIQQEKIDPDQVIAVGDGANDLLMLKRAGLGIAFNAKPLVQKAAGFTLNQRDLKQLLYFLGLSELEISEALGRFQDLC